MSFEIGTFEFLSGETTKTVNLTETYSLSPVVNITNNKNINIYLTDIQNNYFIVEKNSEESATVYYVVIESDS